MGDWIDELLDDEAEDAAEREWIEEMRDKAAAEETAGEISRSTIRNRRGS